MRGRMRAALGAAVAAAGVAGASAGAAQAALPKVLTQGTPAFAIRPAAIGYTGDGTGFIGGADGSGPTDPGHLRWTTYTQRQGRATGVVWLNDCEPSCAGGTFAAVPVRVHVFSPHAGRFRRLTLQFTYEGRPVTDRRVIHRYGRTWEYAIP